MESGTAELATAQSGTPSVSSRLGRISSYVLPFAAAAAAFGAPSAPTLRRTFSGAGISRSEAVEATWVLDEFVYTEEMGTLEQVHTLNALLALPAIESFQVELPD
jgi:hypothetical protein